MSSAFKKQLDYNEPSGRFLSRGRCEKKKREKKRRATLERERGTATLKARLAEIAPEIGALYPGPSSPFNWP